MDVAGISSMYSMDGVAGMVKNKTLPRFFLPQSIRTNIDSTNEGLCISVFKSNETFESQYKN